MTISMEFTPENLERAVTLFYHTEANQQAEVHQWLTEAQNSPLAWNFVWELLNRQKSSEVQFFAASTLHGKLLKAWSDIPEQQYDLLKKRILDMIMEYAMGPKIILNRLCITLSTFIIRTITTHWQNAFEELISSFQSCNLPTVDRERMVWILLEILTVLPEVFQTMTLTASYRNQVRMVFQNVSKSILNIVEMCLSSNLERRQDEPVVSMTIVLNSCKCASEWTQFGGISIADFSSIMDLMVQVMCQIYWFRAEKQTEMLPEELELFNIASEALSAIMLHQHSHKYENHVTKHTGAFLDKFGNILDCEYRSADMNKEIVANIYELLVTAADAHVKLFVNNLKSEDDQLGRNLLGVILRCTDFPGFYPVDETISNMTFGVWYTLQDYVLNLDAGDCAQILLKIKPYYRELICVMLRKSMYSSTCDNPNSGWSLDDKEMFRCYRQDIADTFMYCYSVLNLELLDILTNKFDFALQECHKNPQQNWCYVETCLHAYTSIAECVDLDQLYLPKFFASLKNIPYDKWHSKVLASTLDTIGAYSEWMCDNPQTLLAVVPLVMSALLNPDVAPHSTMTLKDITHNCQRHLSHFSEPILRSAQAALNAGFLKLTERIRIMYSLGKVLSILDVGHTMEYLSVILRPNFEEISTLLRTQNVDQNVTNSLLTNLKLLSALFCTLCMKMDSTADCQQPLLVIVKNTLPLYVEISEKFCDDAQVMEVLCGLLKHIVTTLLDDSKPIIADLLGLIGRGYARCPHASLLVVAKTVLIMFGKEPEHEVLITQLFYQIVSTTLEMCSHYNALNNLSEKSDVVENFFSLLVQIAKRNPKLIYDNNINVLSLFHCAITCLSLNELQPLKACTSFTVNFIGQSREYGQAEIVQNCGEALVTRVLLNLAGHTPRTCIEVFADIFLILNKKYCDNLARWLPMILAQAEFPASHVSAQQKENFAKIVLREKANKRKLSDTIMEFALYCRGILKIDNAA